MANAIAHPTAADLLATGIDAEGLRELYRAEKRTSNRAGFLAVIIEAGAQLAAGVNTITHGPASAAAPSAPKINSRPKLTPAAGRYGVRAADGHVILVQVDRPEQGKWAGYTFVKQLIGTPGDYRGENVGRHLANRYLAAISRDQQAAAQLYGRTTSTCGHCHAALSNVRSRCAAYGKDCAEKHGYWYPTQAEALAWERAQQDEGNRAEADLANAEYESSLFSGRYVTQDEAGSPF